MNTRDELAEILGWEYHDWVEARDAYRYACWASSDGLKRQETHPIPDRDLNFIARVWEAVESLEDKNYKWTRDNWQDFYVGGSAYARGTGDFYADWSLLLLKTLRWLEANDKPALAAVRKAVNR